MLDRHLKTHAAHGLKLKAFLLSPPLTLPLTSPSPSLSLLFPPLLYPSPYFTFSFSLPPSPPCHCTLRLEVIVLQMNTLISFCLIIQSEDQRFVVTQLHYTEWPEHGRPLNTTSMVELMDTLTRTQMSTGNKPIVVHCKYVLSFPHHAFIHTLLTLTVMG